MNQKYLQAPPVSPASQTHWISCILCLFWRDKVFFEWSPKGLKSFFLTYCCIAFDQSFHGFVFPHFLSGFWFSGLFSLVHSWCSSFLFLLHVSICWYCSCHCFLWCLISPLLRSLLVFGVCYFLFHFLCLVWSSVPSWLVSPVALYLPLPCVCVCVPLFVRSFIVIHACLRPAFLPRVRL